MWLVIASGHSRRILYTRTHSTGQKVKSLRKVMEKLAFNKKYSPVPLAAIFEINYI